jgi:hypothetical protein
MIFAFQPHRNLQTRISSQKYLAVTPLFATLTDHSQIPENKTTLSSVFATLTIRVKHKSFVCHSYKKHPGWGYISCALSLTVSRTTHHLLDTIPFRMRTSAKRTRNSFRFRTSKTQDLKPFRIRTYEKPPGGSPLAFIAGLRSLCHNHRSCIAARDRQLSGL